MTCVKAIGGYFGFESQLNDLIYPEAYPVNLGRCGLLKIAIERKYTDIWLPVYICQDLTDYLKNNQINVKFYRINEKLEPVTIPLLKKNEGFVYVNYFGIKDEKCNEVAKSITNIILDLSQAFFYNPPQGVDAFNSARKFIGVPDGGFVFGSLANSIVLPSSHSFDRINHLSLRSDGLIKEGYTVFKEFESSFYKMRPSEMSQLTQTLIKSINKKTIISKRLDNFNYVHQNLVHSNQLQINTSISSPLCYPFLVENGNKLKEKLISNSIFVPTYWPDITIDGKYFESVLPENLVCLPIDQRYDCEDMMRILRIING